MRKRVLSLIRLVLQAPKSLVQLLQTSTPALLQDPAEAEPAVPPYMIGVGDSDVPETLRLSFEAFSMVKIVIVAWAGIIQPNRNRPQNRKDKIEGFSTSDLIILIINEITDFC